MEVPAIDIGVVCNLRNDVRVQVRGAWVIGGIELRAKLGVKCEWEDRFAHAYKLLGVLHCDAHSPVFIGMIGKTDLWSTCPGKANLVIEVHVLGKEDVGRVW